jgi:hypothetical protein
MSALVRRLLLVAITVGLLLAVPGRADAQLNPCAAKAPAPRRPDTGMPGWFATRPAEPPPAPVPGQGVEPEDLFATYGTAGLWWPTWDLGCSGSAEGLITDIANLPMDWMAATLNGTASVRQLAWEDDWIHPVDEAVSALADRVEVFYGVAMGLALAAVGVWILYRARTAEYGEITTTGAWALLLLGLAALALSYPARAGRIYDDVVIGSAKLVNDALAGDMASEPGIDPAVAQINADVAYRVWLRGMFGSDTTRTAEEFGPRFYSAMAFSWSELPVLDAGGPRAEALVEAHRQAFVDTARALERVDPSAYRAMQGKGAFSTRVPTGLIGLVLVGSLCFVTGIAAALVLVARLVGRGLVMALPVVVPFGALYRWSGPVRKLGGIAQAVVVALITATVAGGLLTRGVGALLATNWPLWLVGLVALLATLVAWRALRPAGTMAALVGLAGVARAPRHAVGALLTRWGARSGARDGVAAGLAAEAMVDDDGPRRLARAEDHAAEPPPAPLAAPGVAAAISPPPPPGRSRRSTAGLPSGPEPSAEVLDMHLVVGADGREVYEVYQRPEPAVR